MMNRQELIDAVASDADLSKKQAGDALSAVIGNIEKALAKGDSVQMVGFGTFEVRKRGARTGRNPQTGQTIQISAKKVPAFKAGNKLKAAVM